VAGGANAARFIFAMGDTAMDNNLLAKQIPLPRPNLPRSGDEVAIDQLAVFGELLVVLARYMDRAQNTIKWLTVVLTVLTAVLVIDALLRWFVH
jgi:hypothetical protein